VRLSPGHHNNFKVNFQHFQLVELNGKQNNVWKGLWITIIWMIWNHRITVIYRQGKVNAKQMLFMILLYVCLWMKYCTFDGRKIELICKQIQESLTTIYLKKRSHRRRYRYSYGCTDKSCLVRMLVLPSSL